MPETKRSLPGTDGIALVKPAIRRILVVDDSRMQRKILSASLKRWGYQVDEAGTAEEGLTLCRANPYSLIVSDWVMPGMSGLEFCRALRAIETETYGYFILLTSKSEKDEIARGLSAGADDFLTKPVNAHELRARIAAGERILGMQTELVEKNRIVSKALAELKALYDSLDRDLMQAQKLQQSLLREHFRAFGNSRVSLMLRASGRVGGDLVGFYPISEGRLGIYSLDVSGHGVTAALITARIAGFLSSGNPAQNIALRRIAGGGYEGRSPEDVAGRLNRLLLEEMETDSYFTIVLAEINLGTGAVRMVQAGHPHPMIHRADGTIELIGEGGLPIGLLPDAEFDCVEAELHPGDRLLLYSDGLTECPDPDGALLDEDGLSRLLTRHADLSGPELLQTLVWELQLYAGGGDFPDDLSAILFEFDSPEVKA